MNPVNPIDIFEFSTFILDVSTFRLLKDGQEIEIELQVFETLLLLIKNNDRLVTKEELLQVVWGGRLVTDSVITRTIYEIRKIIDADGNSQSMIRTVRGKGYQFVAEVNVRTLTHKNKVTDVKHEANKGSLKLFVLLIALVVLSLIVWAQYYSQKKTDAKIIKTTTTNPVYPIVAVLPINVDGGSETLSNLTQSVMDYLTTQLALNLRMKVVHPDSISVMSGQQSDIWSIQKATRAHYIIEGFLETVSDSVIRMHLTLHKTNDKNELTPYALGGFEFPYPHTTKDLNDLYKQRKIIIREIISLIKPGVIINDGGKTETHDPQAYRMVIAAHHIMRTDSCEKIYESEDLLKQAIERDPQFVPAWNHLFSNYFKRIWVCGESTDNYQKALEVAEIIEKLAPNTYKTVAIARNGILIENNQVEAAYEYVKDADWDDPEALYRRVYALRYAGFLNLASQNIDRMLQIDPYYFNEKPIHQAPNTLLYLNRFDDHLALLAEPGNAYHDYYRGLNLMLNNKVKEAKEILQGVIQRTPNDLFGQFSSALLHIMTGENDASKKFIDAIVSKRVEKNHSDGEMTYKLVQLYALSGNTQKAVSQLQLSVNQGFFPVNYFKTDPALNSIQNETSFNRIIIQAKSRHLDFAQKFNLKSEVN